MDSAVRQRWAAIEWDSDEQFRLDDVEFRLTTTDYTLPTTPGHFVFLKNRAFLDNYARLFDECHPRSILEIGFFHGASLAFYDLLLRPSRIVGLDLVATAPALMDYIARHGRADYVHPYFGINQADRATTTRLLEREFPERDLDLIIDDASHMYQPTRSTFECAFPFLRENGLYVIEDWGWPHWAGWQDTNPPLIAGAGLSTLIFELVMIQASSPDLIRSLHVDGFRAIVTKGTSQVTGPLHLETCYRVRDAVPDYGRFAT